MKLPQSILARACWIALLAHPTVALQVDDGSTVRQLYENRQWEKAAEMASKILPQSADLIFYRGMALAHRERLEEAATAFQQGAKLFPQDGRFAAELAGVAFRRHRESEAKHWLRRAIKLNPSDAYNRDFLGTLYLLDDNLPAALKYWNPLGKPLLTSVVFDPPSPLSPPLTARTFPVSGGQVLTVKRLATAQANLERLDVFSATAFDLQTRSNGESQLQIRNANRSLPLGNGLARFLPALRGLPYQALMPEFYNWNGRAINLRSLLRWDSNKRRVAIDVNSPWRENPQIEMKFSVDGRDERWAIGGARNSVTVVPIRTLKVGAAVTFALTENLEWTPGLRFAVRDYKAPASASPIQQQSPDLLRGGASAEIDNRFDYRLWRRPESRMEVRGWTNLRAGRFSASRMTGIEGGIQGSWFPQASGDRYELRSRLAVSRLWGDVPLDELYIAGMERDNPDMYWLRGHPAAREGRKGTAPLGNEIEVGQLDFTRRIFSVPFVHVYLGPWFDFGRTAAAGSLSSPGWSYDAGLEARIATIGGVGVRLIYGRDLRNGRGTFYTATSR